MTWNEFRKNRMTLGVAKSEIFDAYNFPEAYKDFVVEYTGDFKMVLWVNCDISRHIKSMRAVMGAFEVKHFEGVDNG